MEKMNIEQAYEKVNAVAPELPVPALTFDEAEKAVRKMYRHLTGNKLPYPVIETTGNRYSWLRNGEWRVNVSRGLSDLIHLFSHWYHARGVGGRPHSKSHARIERRLRAWAVDRGWFNGTLKSEEREIYEETPEEARMKLIERRRAQVVRLERKIKALTTRAKKAKRSLKALERYEEKGSP